MSAVILTPAESRIVLLRSAAGYRIVRPSGYVLPVAGASTLGGVKVGSGLAVAGDGTLSATGGVWGSITGTLSSQSDLNSALAARALTSGTLAQFAATTSAELAGVLTDETGSGSVVFSASPTLTGTVVVRQTGGTAGTHEVQVSHDGTNGTVRAASGELRLHGTSTTASFRVIGDQFRFAANNSANDFTIGNGGIGIPILQMGGANCYMVRNTSFEVRSDGMVAFQNSTNVAGGTRVLGLARLDDNTVEINNGTRTASGGALRGLSVSSLTASGTVTANGGLVDLASVANPWPIPPSQSGLRRFGNFTEVWNNNSFAANRAGACWIIGSAMRFGVSPDTTAGVQFGVTAEDVTLSRNAPGVWQMGTTANNALGSLLLTNLTASGVVQAGNGSAAAPSLTVGAANRGLFFSGFTSIAHGGVESASFSTTAALVRSLVLSGTGTPSSAAIDTRLRRSSASVVDLDTGTDDSFADLRVRGIRASGVGGAALFEPVNARWFASKLHGLNDVEGTTNYVIGESSFYSATAWFKSMNPGHNVVRLRAHSTQTAPFLLCENNAGTVLASVSAGGGATFSREIDLNAIAAMTHGLTVRTTGGGKALRVMSSDLGTEFFSVSSAGNPTLGTNKYIEFPHSSLIGDPNQIVTGGGTGLGITSSGSIFFATGGSTRRLTLDASGNLTMSGRLAFATSDAAPANTTTPLLWMDVLVGGNTYKMPLYQ